jgi:hypothetical protein
LRPALMDEKLRQELADLRARVKPRASWTSFQDNLEQRMIAARIRLLQTQLEPQETAHDGN